jgi:hypothetical protein
MILYYFAYGSNMSSARLAARVPTAEVVGPARLEGWEIRFDKHGRDDTAKANIGPRPGQHLWGVLYRFPAGERTGLDAAEDLGRGYRADWLEVSTAKGARIVALTYVGIKLKTGLVVLDWYREHCLVGAREHALPDGYVAHLRAVFSNGSVRPPGQRARAGSRSGNGD